MPTKKTTTARAPKSFTVQIQLPGVLPEDMKVKSGTKIRDVVEARNLSGYNISVNGDSKSESYELQKGDIVRVGLKTKNN